MTLSFLKITRDGDTSVQCLAYTKYLLVWNTLHMNFMVTPCINNIQHFNFQLMHTTLKKVELLKHFKISTTAPVLLILKCFNNSTFFNVVCISWKLKC